MPSPVSRWIGHRIASHPPPKFAAGPNIVLMTSAAR
jgi:hypothetical protein